LEVSRLTITSGLLFPLGVEFFSVITHGSRPPHPLDASTVIFFILEVKPAPHALPQGKNHPSLRSPSLARPIAP
jgi:hypothetical protein